MAENTRVSIDAKGLRVLYEHAVIAGTLSGWASIAMEYAEAAEKRVGELERELKAAEAAKKGATDDDD